MGRNSCYYKQKLRKGLWSPEEDEKLMRYITKHGHGCWSSVPKLAGLQRCGKSCRLRWINYLRPDLKRGAFTQQEENLVIELQAKLGNRWSQIAAQLPGRTDNEIKNQWNSSIKKKLMMNSIDPSTHKSISEVRNEVTATNSAQKAFEEQGTVISMKANPPPVEFDELFGDLTSSKIDNLIHPTLSNMQEFLPGKSKGLNDVPDINCAASNSTDYFSFQVQQFNHGSSPTFFTESNLFGRQKMGHFESDQEMSLKTLFSAQNRYKPSSTSILSESVYTPNSRSYWETSNSGNCSSISSSKSSESQNRPMYDVNNLPWGFQDDSGSSDKPQLHLLDDCETAYMKWPEYLNIPADTADGYPTLPSFTSGQPERDGDGD